MAGYIQVAAGGDLPECSGSDAVDAIFSSEGIAMIRRLWILIISISVIVAVIAWAIAPVSTARVFTVSSVTKASEPLPTRPAHEVLHEARGQRFEACAKVVEQAWLSQPIENHPLVVASLLAFADHRPLALSPDIIWLLINQMAARTVLADPARYRSYLAAHQEGSRTLMVRRDQFVPGSPTNDWEGVFAEFEQQLLAQVTDPVVESFSHSFSSSTSCEVAARRLTLMNAVSPFYRYDVSTFCGIPEIELFGSVEDWRWIRLHVEDFRKLGMNRRVDALMPVLDQFIAAANGKIDTNFWISFFKYQSVSDGTLITGWINQFFANEDAPDRLTKEGTTYPLGYIDQDFVWSQLGTNVPMLFRAGFMGISQDARTLTLKPQIAWQVLQTNETIEQCRLRDYLRQRQTGLFQIARLVEYDAEHKICRLSMRALRPENEPENNIGESATEQNHVWRHYLPLEAWKKILPMLDHMTSVGLMSLSDSSSGASLDLREICRELLALPRVENIYLPSNADPECLRILSERKDWKVEVIEERIMSSEPPVLFDSK